MTRPIAHPSTLQRLQEVAGRFLAARREQQEAENFMWAGRLTSFTTDDLELLDTYGYLSPRDHALLKKHKP